jgi:AAA domain
MPMVAPERTLTPVSVPVRRLWRDKLKLGGLALLAGNVGLGKSTIAVDVAAGLTRGTLPGEYADAPQDVIICATEDEWADTVVPRLMAANADLDRVWQLTTAQEYGPDLMLPVQVPELAGLIAQSGGRLVILDPLMSRLDGRLDSHKDAEVRRALEPLVRMAGDAGVTVLGLIHQNKSGDHDAVNRVMGSRAFTAVARSVLYAAPLLTRDPSGGTLVLAVAKNNLAPRGTADAYQIEPHMLPGPPPLITTTRIRWLDKLEAFMLDAELAEAGKRKAATAVDRAAEWLAGYLSKHGGRADSADVRKDGKAAGHSVATLKRATAEAGVSTENTQTTPRRTIWVLDDYEGAPAQDGEGAPRARGVPKPAEPTEPTGRQESVCELTKLTDLRERDQLQSAQSAQVSDPPREAEPTDHPVPPPPDLVPVQRAILHRIVSGEGEPCVPDCPCGGDGGTNG